MREVFKQINRASNVAVESKNPTGLMDVEAGQRHLLIIDLKPQYAVNGPSTAYYVQHDRLTFSFMPAVGIHVYTCN